MSTNQNPPAQAGQEQPTSPAVVKKTPMRPPKELELEKRIAELQDRLDGLNSWKDEVNNFLAELDGKVKTAITPRRDDWSFYDDFKNLFEQED